VGNALTDLADAIWNFAGEEARRTTALLRRGRLLSVESDDTVTLLLGYPEDGVTVDVLEDTETLSPVAQPSGIAGVPVLAGASADVGEDVVVLQQGSGYIVLGGFGSINTTPTYEIAIPQPFGGWRWYAPYGYGLAQRNGRFVSMTGMIERTTFGFTPQGASTYEYVVAPWPADTSQTGLIWSSIGAPLRWYMPAGSKTVYFLKSSTAQTVSEVVQATSGVVGGLISCQFTYSTTAAAAASRLVDIPKAKA
jgi:hypothetical protein